MVCIGNLQRVRTRGWGWKGLSDQGRDTFKGGSVGSVFDSVGGVGVDQSVVQDIEVDVVDSGRYTGTWTGHQYCWSDKIDVVWGRGR